MNKQLQKIEKEVSEKYLLDKYKAVCEVILDTKMYIKFLQTEECAKFLGSEPAKAQLVTSERGLAVREAEKAFLESQL